MLLPDGVVKTMVLRRDDEPRKAGQANAQVGVFESGHEPIDARHGYQNDAVRMNEQAQRDEEDGLKDAIQPEGAIGGRGVHGRVGVVEGVHLPKPRYAVLQAVKEVVHQIIQRKHCHKRKREIVRGEMQMRSGQFAGKPEHGRGYRALRNNDLQDTGANVQRSAFEPPALEAGHKSNRRTSAYKVAKHGVLSLALLLFAPLQLSGQSASGLLAPNRYIDWSQAGATLPTGTIPNCATQPATGSVANITAAFNADKGGASYCVINIPSGTVTEASSLILSYAGNANVILRGAGPNSTVLKFTGTSTTCFGIGATAVCSYNGSATAFGYSPDTCSITSGVAQGSTSVTFGSWPGSTFVPSYTGCSLSDLHVGSLVQITQQDDGTTDTGNIWMHGNGPSGTSAWETWGGASNSWVPNFTTAGNPGRSLSQNVTVTGISGSTVTFSPALYSPTWNQSKVPYASFANILPLSNFGIENLTIDTSSLGDNEAMLNSIWNKNTWVKNVRFVAANVNYGTGTSRKHVLVNSSSHMTIRDSYFFGSAGASDGYGVDLSWGTSDTLVENNIFQHISTGTITENGSGNVFGYNYAVDNYFNNGDPAWQQCDAFHHDAGDHFNLWEGHEGICTADDDFHGPSFGITHFRSYFSGFDPANTCPGTSCGTTSKLQNVTAYADMAFNRYENFVMNVIGSPSITTYQNVGPSALSGGVLSNCPSVPWFVAYSLNYSDQNQLAWSTQGGIGGNPCFPSSFNLDNDPLTSQSLVRWGNYDTVNAAVRTNSGETGSTAPVYPGLNSPSTTWGSYKSLYLSAQPSWWGSMPWPAVGPDVTGGNIANVGGHAYHNPAANCYLNVMGGATNGSSGPLAFDAASCYSSAPPTNPTLTVTAVNGSISGTNCTSGTYTSGTSIGTCAFTPNPSYHFNGWSGTGSASCSGTGTCGPFNITANSTLTANASLNAWNLSAAISGTGMGTITCTPAVGIVTSGTSVSCAITPNAGSTITGVTGCGGTWSSSPYTFSMPNNDCTVTAAMQGTVATPSFSPGGGSYTSSQIEAISDSTPGAAIHYTSDGTTPTCSSTAYSTPITVASSTTLKAIGCAASYTDSAVATAVYTFTCGDPSQLGPNYSGTYLVPPTTLPMTVGFTSPTSGCAMHYTSDGFAPTCSSTAYPVGDFTISAVGSYTYRVIACQSGYTSSSIIGGGWSVQNAGSTSTGSVGVQLQGVVIQ